MPDLIDELRSKVTADLSRARDPLKGVWSEVSRIPVPPSPQEQWDQFMNMPAEQRRAMVEQMGPEAYQSHVKDMIEMGEQFVGPEAQNLEPYFLQDVQDMLPVYGTPDATSAEAELQSLLDEAVKGLDLGGK